MRIDGWIAVFARMMLPITGIGGCQVWVTDVKLTAIRIWFMFTNNLTG